VTTSQLINYFTAQQLLHSSVTTSQLSFTAQFHSSVTTSQLSDYFAAQ